MSATKVCVKCGAPISAPEIEGPDERCESCSDGQGAVERVASWLEGYRVLASGRSVDPEEIHSAWVNSEPVGRVLRVSDLAEVLRLAGHDQ